MAYNKDNYKDNRLTPKQEKFVEEIAKGKTQYEAYITAYPTAKKWTRNSVDVKANELRNNVKIMLRLEELNKLEENRIKWTRQRALNEINYVLDINKQDIQRQQQGYDEELALKNQELKEWVELLSIPNIDKDGVQARIKELIKEISYIKQRRRVSAVNTNGILNAARVLNRMYGYDITKVEINHDDEERENMKALSKEELKAIAYANINREDANEG